MTDLLTPEIEKHRGTTPLGTTQPGIDWALKALHPAGGAHSDGGIPDGMSRPTAKWTTTSTHVVSRPSGTGDTWDCDLVFFSHPMFLGYYHSVYGEGDSQGNFWNPNLFPETPITDVQYNAGLGKFLEMAERYRPLFHGITLTPIASTLANQGTILCAQYPQVHREMAKDYQSVEFEARQARKVEEKYDKPTSAARVGSIRRNFPNKELFYKNLTSLGGADKVLRDASNLSVQTRVSLIDVWSQYYQDLNALNMLPRVYSANFAEGCYAPYKFTPDSRQWRNGRDLHFYNSTVDAAAFELDPTLLQAASVTTATPGYPYVIPGECREFVGWGVLPRGDTNVIHIALRGMSPSASFKLTIRTGWEFETLPGSTIASFVSGPIEPDPSAIVSYSLIVRKLADAYPEKYNSWEKLVDVIDQASQAAGVIFPGASVIGKGAKFLYNLLSGPKKESAPAQPKKKPEQSVATELAALKRQLARAPPPPRYPAPAPPASGGRQKRRKRQQKK